MPNPASLAGGAQQITLPFGALGAPTGIALGAGGDVYVTEGGVQGRVLRLTKGASEPTTLPFPSDRAYGGIGIATDGAVYVTCRTDNWAGVMILPTGSAEPRLLYSYGDDIEEKSDAPGVAVARDDTLFVAVNLEVAKYPPGATEDGSVTVMQYGGGFSTAVAVGPDGTAYAVFADWLDVLAGAGNPVLKVSPGSTAQVALAAFSDDLFAYPTSVAVDHAGNVYVAGSNTVNAASTVLRLDAGADAPVEVPFIGVGQLTGLAVDDGGDLYAVDTTNNKVIKLSGSRS